jgi:hypothetical protein
MKVNPIKLLKRQKRRTAYAFEQKNSKNTLKNLFNIVPFYNLNIF